MPEDVEIESMTATLGMPIKNPGVPPDKDFIPEFAVPVEHIPKIMSQLGPAEKDYEPLAWFWLGELKLKYKDGRDLKLRLFYISETPGRTPPEIHKEGKGAFSIAGPHGDVYFRGGKSESLKAAIEAAYADFKEKNKN
jgi:hypothetical protein